MSEHDNKGLVSKYLVLKQENGRWMEKETPCFVLSPEKKDAYGWASCEALIAYAKSILPTNRALARDLLTWVARIRGIPAEKAALLSGVQHMDEPIGEVLRGLRDRFGDKAGMIFTEEQYNKIRAVRECTGMDPNSCRDALIDCEWDVGTAIARLNTPKSGSTEKR